MATKEQIVDALKKTKFTQDRFGNFKMIATSGKEYRVKIQQNSVRLESAYTVEPSQFSLKKEKHWAKITGAYFKDVIITDTHVTIGSKKIKCADNNQ